MRPDGLGLLPVSSVGTATAEALCAALPLASQALIAILHRGHERGTSPVSPTEGALLDKPPRRCQSDTDAAACDDGDALQSGHCPCFFSNADPRMDRSRVAARSSLRRGIGHPQVSFLAVFFLALSEAVPVIGTVVPGFSLILAISALATTAG